MHRPFGDMLAVPLTSFRRCRWPGVSWVVHVFTRRRLPFNVVQLGKYSHTHTRARAFYYRMYTACMCVHSCVHGTFIYDNLCVNMRARVCFKVIFVAYESFPSITC